MWFLASQPQPCLGTREWKIQTHSAQSTLSVGGFRETPRLSITDSALHEIPGMKQVASLKGDPLRTHRPLGPETSWVLSLDAASQTPKGTQPKAVSDFPWP